jgi:hypothetical protein
MLTLPALTRLPKLRVCCEEMGLFIDGPDRSHSCCSVELSNILDPRSGPRDF